MSVCVRGSILDSCTRMKAILQPKGGRVQRSRVIGLVVPLLCSGCGGSKPPEQAPVPVAVVPETLMVHDTVRVRDGDMDQRAARLELKLLEKEAQVDELQSRLEDAQQEVVRAMAKLQTAATRAEAASGMAEAELAVRSQGQSAANLAQAQRLLSQSTETFNKGNYGGALYLANQAKLLAGAGKGRERATRPGEVAFAPPVRLKTTSRANVRVGPGASYRVAFTVESGATVVGHSYTEGWIRISDDAGRSGWVSRTLLGRRAGGAP